MKNIAMLMIIVLCTGVICPILPTGKVEDGKLEGISAKEPIETKLSASMEQFTGELEQAVAVTNSPTTITSPKDALIMLDAGHGGEDEGGSKGGILEKDINMQIAFLTGEMLKEMGYQVAYTREDDVELSLEERVIAAEQAGADAFVSIHQNACDNGSVTGIETWYSETKEGTDSKRLAGLLQMYMVENAGAKDRGIIAEEGLVVIRECSMASCLVECGFISNRSERTKLVNEEYQEKIAGGIAKAIHYYFFPKTMYLTFDDGPTAKKTDRILDILKKLDIKATFFLVGENVQKHPQVAKRIADEGHTIGIHCNSHDYDVIYQSAESYLADFLEAQQIVYEATGVKSNLFRFPGGSVNAYNKKVSKDIIEEMTKQGYVYFDWNGSLEDAVKNPDRETLLFNAKSSTLGRKRIVMLAHDTVEETVICLEDLIAQFPEYQFLPLDEDVEPVQF